MQASAVISTEISTVFWDYSGQLLRSFTDVAKSTSLYHQLHRTAEKAFGTVAVMLREGVMPAQVVDA